MFLTWHQQVSSTKQRSSNSPPNSAAYMRHWTGPTLVYMKPCHLMSHHSTQWWHSLNHTLRKTLQWIYLKFSSTQLLSCNLAAILFGVVVGGVGGWLDITDKFRYQCVYIFAVSTYWLWSLRGVGWGEGIESKFLHSISVIYSFVVKFPFDISGHFLIKRKSLYTAYIENMSPSSLT